LADRVVNGVKQETFPDGKGIAEIDGWTFGYPRPG
jgi:hypothetical protein